MRAFDDLWLRGGRARLSAASVHTLTLVVLLGMSSCVDSQPLPDEEPEDQWGPNADYAATNGDVGRPVDGGPGVDLGLPRLPTRICVSDADGPGFANALVLSRDDDGSLDVHWQPRLFGDLADCHCDLDLVTARRLGDEVVIEGGLAGQPDPWERTGATDCDDLPYVLYYVRLRLSDDGVGTGTVARTSFAEYWELCSVLAGPSLRRRVDDVDTCIWSYWQNGQCFAQQVSTAPIAQDERCQ